MAEPEHKNFASAPHFPPSFLLPSAFRPPPKKEGIKEKGLKFLASQHNALSTLRMGGEGVARAPPTETQEAPTAVYYLRLRPQVFEEASPATLKAARWPRS